MTEQQHATRPQGQRMGQKTGACSTCGAPVWNDRGIWKHTTVGDIVRVVVDADTDPFDIPKGE